SRYEKARQDPRSNDFWQSQMRDIEPSILVNPLRADQVQMEMQKAIHETLIDRHQQFCFPVSPKHFKDAAHYNHTTIPILFHAAWALTLSTYLSTRDVVLGSVVSGRRGEYPGMRRHARIQEATTSGNHRCVILNQAFWLIH
ncbi:hypothetical protein EWS82_13105, partial [Staphylococcus xylosus]|nr:hypothetical protein [Staphylococcus xylosus]